MSTEETLAQVLKNALIPEIRQQREATRELRAEIRSQQAATARLERAIEGLEKRIEEDIVPKLPAA